MARIHLIEDDSDIRRLVAAALAGGAAPLQAQTAAPAPRIEFVPRAVFHMSAELLSGIDDPRFRWDVSVATGKQGGFAWVDAQGNPSRGDPALRGSASLNHSGVAALFAGAPKPPAEVFAAAAASTPQAFDLPARVSIHREASQRK